VLSACCAVLRACSPRKNCRNASSSLDTGTMVSPRTCRTCMHSSHQSHGACQHNSCVTMLFAAWQRSRHLVDARHMHQHALDTDCYLQTP
jgi:hypothetical protein